MGGQYKRWTAEDAGYVGAPAAVSDTSRAAESVRLMNDCRAGLLGGGSIFSK